MNWRPDELTYPQLLLVGLAAVLVLTILVAGATSTSPLSAYNADWDGTSEFRELAQSSDRSATIVRETSAYEAADPNASIAIILSPTGPYSEEERQEIRAFAEGGGTVLLAGDVNNPVRGLLESMESDVSIAGPPLRDEREYYRGPALPVATNVSESPYTAGMDSLTLNHGTALAVDGDAEVVVSSSEYGYLDVNDDGAPNEDERMGHVPVVATESVGKGELIVVSDASVFLNAMLDRDGNRQFAQNVIDARETVLLDYSHTGGVPPIPMAVLTIRDTLYLQALIGLFGVLAVAVGTRYDRGRETSAMHERGNDRSTRDLAETIASTHPEWDEEYVRRVTASLEAQDTRDRPESD